MRSLVRFLGETMVLLLSALLNALAFPSFLSSEGWASLAFIAWIPVFFVINRASWKTVWLEGLIYGFAFYLIYNYWLTSFHPLAILIVPIVKSAQYLLLFPALKLCKTLFSRRGYLVQALVFTFALYLTQQGFLGYPYGNLASAVYSWRTFIQIASITGVWGIILLMITPQAFLGMLLDRRANVLKWKVDIMVYAGCLAATLLFGVVSLTFYRMVEPRKMFRIAAVQHSADSWKGGYATYKQNYEVLRDFSEESLREKPDMILWSETAFVPSVAWHKAHPSDMRTRRLVDDFVEFGKSLPVPLVTGNPEGLVKDRELPAFLKDGSWNWKTYNTVILFGGGDILGTYRKQNLVPFTENFPYEKEFPRLYALLKANDYKWWEKGEEATVFNCDGVKFSTPICYEDTFGSLNAEFVRGGAQMLLNLSNDSWSGAVSAEMQHLSLAVFRAVENRRPLVRGTNSGMTCMVLPTGEIVEPMEPFTKGYHVYDVPLDQKKGLTFYCRHPDLLVKLDGLLLVCLFVMAMVRKGREHILWKRYGHLADNVDV